jgi:hypothetical protein
MVFLIKRTARHLKGQLEGQMSTAILAGPLALAAGVLSYGIHEYQELGWLPDADFFIWDVTSAICILGCLLSDRLISLFKASGK